MMNGYKRVGLAGIKFNVDFRSSEASNYDQLLAKKHFKQPPTKNQVYLMVSRSGNQAVWILRACEAMDGREILDTRRWRLRRGTWSFRMIENYANEIGLSLVGYKRFEADFLESRKRKKEA